MTRMKTKSFIVAALVAIAPTISFAQDKPLTPLRVATLKIAAQTDVWVAQQRGIYAKNGIDAKISFFNSGAESIPAMQGGAVDVLLSIPGIGMLAMERGIDLAAIFQDEIAHAAPPDSASVQVMDSSPVRSLADLRGKKVGVGGLATQNTIAVKMLLDKAGVDLSSVSFAEVPFTAMVNAIKAGHVDAVVPVDPFTTQLRLSGGRVLAWNYVESIPEQPLGVLGGRVVGPGLDPALRVRLSPRLVCNPLPGGYHRPTGKLSFFSRYLRFCSGDRPPRWRRKRLGRRVEP